MLSNICSKLRKYRYDVFLHNLFKCDYRESFYRFTKANEIYECYKNASILSTGVISINELLEGGLKQSEIYEFIGEFGAGKTQLCHQLAVMVQLPVEQGGLEAKALYIDAEGTFRPERIIQIAKYRKQNPEKTLENIIYARANMINDLLFIFKEIFFARTFENIKIIILDGLSFLIRNYFSDDNSYKKRYRLWRILTNIKNMIEHSNVILIVTNQVVQKIGEKESKLSPANDIFMSLFSVHRLWISKIGIQKRKIFVFNSPVLPHSEAFFKITSNGVIDG